MRNSLGQGRLIIVLLVVGLLIIAGLGIGGFIFFGKRAAVDKITSTSDDGVATLTATFYDANGVPIIPGVSQSFGLPQALLGPDPVTQAFFVSFSLSVTNTGDVELTNVQPTLANAVMDGAFDNIGAGGTPTLATLAVAASNILLGDTKGTICSVNGDCDTAREDCVATQCLIRFDTLVSGDGETAQPLTTFEISVTGGFLDAIGNPQSVTSAPVTLSYDIRGETCIDGTLINTCVFDRTLNDADKPSYCEFIDGVSIGLIDKASSCGCPADTTISGESCIANTCSIGVETVDIGSCTTTETAEGTGFGTFILCDVGSTQVNACNFCGCTIDAQGNPATGCSSAGDPADCTYQSYTGGLTGTIGEA